jgi:hypothetical protein
MDRQRKTWPQAWEMRVGLEWTVAVGPLLGLVDETRRLLATRPTIELSRSLVHEPDWRQSILLAGVNLGTSMLSSGYQIHEIPLHSLYNVAQIIDGMPEARRSLTTEQVNGLDEALKDLRREVMATSDLEDDLRFFLLDQINEMEKRLLRRSATGDGPVLDLITETIGSNAVKANLWTRAQKSPVSTQVIAVLLALHTFIGFGRNTVDDFQDVASVIESTTSVINTVFSGPKAIEAPKYRPELTTGDNAANIPDVSRHPDLAAAVEPGNDSVVDAEIVEEAVPNA